MVEILQNFMALLEYMNFTTPESRKKTVNTCKDGKDLGVVVFCFCPFFYSFCTLAIFFLSKVQTTLNLASRNSKYLVFEKEIQTSDDLE